MAWSYQVLDLHDVEVAGVGARPQDKLQSVLNEQGKQGWELVGPIAWGKFEGLLLKRQS